MSVTWTGLTELRTALQNMPEELAGEASHIVEGAANGAASQIRRVYPVKTGAMVSGVVVEHNQQKVSASAVVRSKSPHAHLFERGTKARRTAKGANRGSMPEAPESEKMVPIVIRTRRRMYVELADMLRRIGFHVGGV